ncbi:MAG: hypothetical protein ACU85U_11905 [Gammaproteobacteria bacterium]
MIDNAEILKSRMGQLALVPIAQTGTDVEQAAAAIKQLFSEIVTRTSTSTR